MRKEYEDVGSNKNNFNLIPLNNQQKNSYFDVADKLISTIAFIIADSGNMQPMKLYSYIVNKAKHFEESFAINAL